MTQPAQFTPTGRVECDGQTLDPQSQALLVRAAATSPGAFRDLPVRVVRNALRDAMATRPPNPIADIRDVLIAAPQGTLRLRVYRPEGAAPLAPGVVFFHGGGWVRGDLDTHSFMCGTIAHNASCVVISVDYRCAPESQYPAAIDDAIHAYTHVSANAEEFGVDVNALAVAGDSAGGTLATGVCLHLKYKRALQPRLQLLLYPISDITREAKSYELFANGFGLTRDTMRWFIEQYAPDASRHADVLASPLHAPDLSGLAPAHVIVAGFDVLRDDGIAYAARLSASGVPTSMVLYPGTYHGFFATPGLDDSDSAIASACGALRDAFAM